MKYFTTLLVILMMASTAYAGGMAVSYEVNGASYEGYYVSPSSNAPLVLPRRSP